MSNIKIVNLTPHPINIMNGDGNIQVTFAPSGDVARVSSTTTSAGTIAGIPVSKLKMGDITGLPASQKDTIYIVSSLVRGQSNRTDLVSPDTSPTGVVRDTNGKIVGVKGFQQ